MKIASIFIDQLEGSPQSATFKKVEQAIQTLEVWCKNADHYKSKYSLTFENGEVYTGNIVLHPGCTTNPIEWAKNHLRGSMVHNLPYGNSRTEAAKFTKEYFPEFYAELEKSLDPSNLILDPKLL